MFRDKAIEDITSLPPLLK